MYVLTFPQKGMLKPKHFDLMAEKIKITIEQSWKDNLSDILTKEYMHTLSSTVKSLYQSPTRIYPEPKNLFRAFEFH